MAVRAVNDDRVTVAIYKYKRELLEKEAVIEEWEGKYTALSRAYDKMLEELKEARRESDEKSAVIQEMIKESDDLK